MTVVNMPIQFVLGLIYCSLVYVLTDQPLEVHRVIMFFTVCYMIALISEAIGMAISSTLNIVVSMKGVGLEIIFVFLFGNLIGFG